MNNKGMKIYIAGPYTKGNQAENVHNAMDLHMLGSVIIRKGKPTLLNRFTDWEMLLR